jgi:hypothetical protein
VRIISGGVRTPDARTDAAALRPAGPPAWEYQAIQTGSVEVVLQVVPTTCYTAGRADQLASRLARLLARQVRVSIEPVAAIESEPSGKRPSIKVGYRR